MKRNLLIVVLSFALTVGSFAAWNAYATCVNPYYHIGCTNCGDEQVAVVTFYADACVDEVYTSVYAILVPEGVGDPHFYYFVLEQLCGSGCKLWRCMGDAPKGCYRYYIYGYSSGTGNVHLWDGWLPCCALCN